MTGPWVWIFVTVQILLDLCVGATIIYWIVQKRRFGTFNPFSPFLHKDVQSSRALLAQFKVISEKTAVLLNQLDQKQRDRFQSLESEPVSTEVLKAIAQPAEPSDLSVRPKVRPAPKNDILRLLREGWNLEKIASNLGTSIEEVRLVQLLQSNSGT